MDLEMLLKDFPSIREFRPEDENKLLNILQDSSMKAGGIELVYDRSPNFSSLLRHQAQNYKTIVLEENGELESFFSVSWGPRYVDGKIKTVAYIGDFRVKNPRSAAKIWRKFYPQFLDAFANQQDPKIDYFFTGILDSNTIAMRSLVERGPRNGFYYHFISSKIMLNVLSRKPLKRKGPTSYKINFFKESDLSDVLHILDEDQKTKIFGYAFVGELSEWERRSRDWHNWNVKDLLVIRKDEDIVAVVLPWSPSSAKRMMVKKVPRLLGVTLRIGNLLRLKTPLPKKEIETLYLTHFGFSKQVKADERVSIQSEVTHFIFNHRKRFQFHMLAIPDAKIELVKKLKSKYFVQNTKVNLYEVSTQEVPSFSGAAEVAFEMCLV